MPDLNNLLDHIDWLDQAATKAPWYGVMDDLADVVQIFHDQEQRSHVADIGDKTLERVWQDAEFIALARTFAPAAAKALRAVLDVADDMSDRAGKTFAIADRTGVEDGKAQAFLRAAVMVRNAITNGFEDDDALGADRE